MNTINQVAETTTAQDNDGKNIINDWIDNAYTPGAEATVERADVTNPATGGVSVQVSLGRSASIDHAIASAQAPIPCRRVTSLSRLPQLLFLYRALLHARIGYL